MAVRRRVNGLRTLWRSAHLTFRQLTKPEEKSQNSALQSTFTHIEETNGSIQNALQEETDRGQRWTATGAGSPQDWDRIQRLFTTDASYLEVDCGQIRIVTRYGWVTELDHMRWMAADQSQEMDHGRGVTINLLSNVKTLRLCEVIPCSTSLILISCHYVLIEFTYDDTHCAGGIAPLNTILSSIQSTTPYTMKSTMKRCRITQLHAQVTSPNTITNQIASHTATILIPHIPMPDEISHQQCNDL